METNLSVVGRLLGELERRLDAVREEEAAEVEELGAVDEGGNLGRGEVLGREELGGSEVGRERARGRSKPVSELTEGASRRKTDRSWPVMTTAQAPVFLPA